MQIPKVQNLRFQIRTAVVLATDAIARTGPLEEAQVKFQCRDGLEVAVLDAKDMLGTNGPQTWFEVRDIAGRSGWMKGDHLAVIGGVRASAR